MSVHPQTVPEWSRHQLADKHRGMVRAQARRIGLCDEDADEEAERQALRLCLEGKTVTYDDIDFTFLSRTKYGLIKRREHLLMERPVSDILQAAQETTTADFHQSYDSIENLFYKAVPPVQEDATFVAECVRFLDLLPHNHRRVMRKLALGMSALDIATEEDAELSDILKEIRTARDWLQDHVKWGE